MTCTCAQCNANWVNKNEQVEVPIHSKLLSMGSGLECMWLCTMELSIHSKHVNTVLPGSELITSDDRSTSHGLRICML